MSKSVGYVLKFTVMITCYLFGSAVIAGGEHPFYGQALCNLSGYTCVKIKSGDTWDKLFKSAHDRELVKRLNRTNMPLYSRSWIVIPTDLKNIDNLSLAPFTLNYDTHHQRMIVVNLAHQAFGAYNEQGQLVHWGPVSGGQAYCKDIDGPCETITGDFQITRKDTEECMSGQFPLDTEGGAPMPYCMHFHRGFAMHGSTLPGYHASHGCVRLLYDDAKWLNEQFTKIGTKVVILNEENNPDFSPRPLPDNG